MNVKAKAKRRKRINHGLWLLLLLFVPAMLHWVVVGLILKRDLADLVTTSQAAAQVLRTYESLDHALLMALVSDEPTDAASARELLEKLSSRVAGLHESRVLQGNGNWSKVSTDSYQQLGQTTRRLVAAIDAASFDEARAMLDHDYSDVRAKFLEHLDATRSRLHEDLQFNLRITNLVAATTQHVVVFFLFAFFVAWHRQERLRRKSLSRQQKMNRLRHDKKAAESANRLKSQFLANMSHEIRTPMNAILGMTHLCRNTNVTPQQDEYLRKLELAATSLLGLLNDILDYSKIEAGKLHVDNEEFRLHEVLDQVASITEVKANEKGLKLIFQTEHGVPDLLRGDPLRLSQVLVNLISNAVKFTDEGHVQVDVKLQSTSTHHAIIKFSVSDTGIGMSIAQMRHLFTPFWQADGSSTRRYGGSGLGLPISRRLVRMMHGQLQVTSQPSVGSTFTFTACFQLVDKSSVLDRAHKPAATGGGTALMSRLAPAARLSGPSGSNCDMSPGEWVNHMSLKGKRILLVEDNQVDCDMTTEILNRAGAKITTAHNGKRALDLLARNRFHLVLMDCHMPMLDGFATTVAIRNQLKLTAMPIIALSASAHEVDCQRCLDSGMDDHIAKPFKVQQLVETIQKWISQGRAPAMKDAESARWRQPGDAPSGQIQSSHCPTESGSAPGAVSVPLAAEHRLLDEVQQIHEEVKSSIAPTGLDELDTDPSAPTSTCHLQQQLNELDQMLADGDTRALEAWRAVQLVLSTSPGITAETLRRLERVVSNYEFDKARLQLSQLKHHLLSGERYVD